MSQADLPSDLSEKVQFVVGSAGKPTAVIIDIGTWEQILEALEDAEDLMIAREASAKARAKIDAADGNLKKAGFISWKTAKAELEKSDDAEYI